MMPTTTPFMLTETRNPAGAAEIVTHPTTTREKVTIPVKGMTCAACQARVQRTLQGKSGVIDASVNLMLKNAAVTYDPQMISPMALVEAIHETGYGAELAVRGAGGPGSGSQEEEYRELRYKASLSGIIGLLAMVLPMPLMGVAGADVHGPVADPFPPQ